MFGSLLGRGSAPQNEPVRANPQPAPQPSPAPAPAGQTPVPAPQAPQPAPAPAPVQTVNPLQEIMASLNPAQTPQPGQAPRAQDPMAFAAQFLEALNDPGAAPQVQQIAPRLNTDLLREAFGQVDMTSGVDIGAVLQGITGQAENGEELLRGALQANSLNVITAMAPLVNRMVEQAVTRAVESSLQQGDHSRISREIVTDFVTAHPHANNPVSMQILSNITNTLIAANPQRVDRVAIQRGLEQFLAGISQATSQPAPETLNIPRGAQTGFGGLFSNPANR